MFFVTIIVYYTIEDTPRYELLMGDLDKGILLTEALIEENGVDLSDEQ